MGIIILRYWFTAPCQIITNQSRHLIVALLTQVCYKRFVLRQLMNKVLNHSLPHSGRLGSFF